MIVILRARGPSAGANNAPRDMPKISPYEITELFVNIKIRSLFDARAYVIVDETNAKFSNQTSYKYLLCKLNYNMKRTSFWEIVEQKI